MENAANIPDNLLFKNVQPMIKEECVVRIYIVRGMDLQAQDSNGKVKENYFSSIKKNIIHLIFCFVFFYSKHW
jgi:hypothetical protein